MEDRIEPLRLLAFAGEAMHPDAVAEQQMVQRAVQRAEEGAAIGAIVGIPDLRRRLVEPLVDPGVIRRQHLELRLHARRPPSLGVSLSTTAETIETPRAARNERATIEPLAG